MERDSEVLANDSIEATDRVLGLVLSGRDQSGAKKT